MGVREILTEWLRFRRDCIVRAATYDRNELSAELHLLKGLEKVLLDIDKAIHIVRNTEKDSEVVPRLMEAFAIDELQAEFVADIKLRNLNKDYIMTKISDIAALEGKIADLVKLIETPSMVNAQMKKELADVSKRFGYDRKTEIVDDFEVIIEAEEEVEDFNLKLFVSEHGYIKKIPLTSLRTAGDHKTKDDDKIVQEIEATNKSEAIFFTNKQNAYKMKLYEIAEHKTSELGDYLPNILQLEKDEEVIFTVVTMDFSGYMLYVFRNGKVARVPLSAYMTKQNRKKLVKAYSDESRLVRMFHILEPTNLTMIRQSSKDVKALTVNSSLVPEKVTKNTQGVQVFRMNSGSMISGAFLADSYTLHDGERFIRQSIPSSGDDISPMDAMTINKWLV